MFRKLIVFFSFVLTTLAVNAEETIHHEFIVELMPATHKINVMDTIHFSKQQMQQVQKDGASFILHAGEQPVLQTGNLKLEEVAMSGDELSQYSVPVKKYKVSGKFAKPLFTVKYEREIAHNLNEIKQGTAETPGLIDDIGVYLAGESAWYPRFNNELVTFTLSVKLPVKWSSVSQGARIYQENEAQYHLDTWQEKSPQDDIYLVAYSFAENSMRVGDVEVMTFLRTPDEALSQRYLGISSQYISMYETLLGKFPYSKFALVENFWESGYGMPSFTLLGESVVRLPFIIYTSYPHELLHNYWGNSVYVDYSQGNWSEGLTTYLADYLLKEQRGQGANYRRGVLQKYTNFTQNGGDFALDKFIARKDQASEAIGYGKTMMLFHMLRRSLGDKKFIEGLRKLYADYQFKFAAFSDIEKIYSELSHTDMHDFFSQWIERVGAPELGLDDVQLSTSNGQYTLSFNLLQQQSEAVYEMYVPVAFTFAGQPAAEIRMLPMKDKITPVKLQFAAKPLRIDLDPLFDVFRKLNAMESPPAISQVLGAKKVLAILPVKASDAMRNAYRQVAESLRNSRYPQIEIVSDDSVPAIASDTAMILFGKENHFAADAIAALSSYEVGFESLGVEIAQKQYAYHRESLILVSRNPKNPAQAIAYVTLHDTKAAEGFARKLPHYGKYGYLAFEGDEPTNILKGEWPTINSPLSVTIGDKSVKRAALPEYPGLLNAF